MPTWARELGSRGLKIGFSNPTITLRLFQSISREAVRMRMAWLFAPAKKSIYTEPWTLPPPRAVGPRNSRPRTVWRTVAPDARGPGAEAVAGYCEPPLC